MDDEIKLKIGDYYFSWDDRKAKRNVAKHGVSFRRAAEVFFDENAYVEPDTTTDEERYHIVGKPVDPDSPVLFVVYLEPYTENDQQLFRLISARKATKREADKYDDHR